LMVLGMRQLIRPSHAIFGSMFGVQG